MYVMATTSKTDPREAAPKLSADQRRAVRSMMEDGGYSRAEAIAMVLGGVCL